MLGCMLGCIDGRDVGCLEGHMVGCVVGCIVGCMVGCRVGCPLYSRNEVFVRIQLCGSMYDDKKNKVNDK